MLDRLVEQCEPWTPWDRRAWEPGSVLAFKELDEALQWQERGVLSEGSVEWLRQSLLGRLGQDDGLAQLAVRQQLHELLRAKIVPGSRRHDQLKRLTMFVEDQYLREWQAAIGRAPAVNVERMSRYVSAHVIDCGHHPGWLQKHTKSLVSDGASIGDVIEAYTRLLSNEPQDFVGIVALTSVPEIELMVKDPRWISATEVSSHLQRFGRSHSSRRQVGGLRLVVSARDLASAALAVSSELQRMAAKTLFLRRPQGLTYAPYFYPEAGNAQSLTQGNQSVTAMSLVRTGVLYSHRDTGHRSGVLDDAVQLASTLVTGTPSVAAAGAWAALESVLVTGSDASDRTVGRSAAADRAAKILTSSWPRAELTRLSYKIDKSQCAGRVCHDLDRVGERNLERAQIIWAGIGSGSISGFHKPRDQAAFLRMTALLSDTRSVLGRVEAYLRSSLRRLYRQRNMVLHGGSDRPIAISATVRTAGPLVAATLDRLVHAAEIDGLTAFEALARSEVFLGSAKSGGLNLLDWTRF